jgi:dolichol kinase
MQPPEYDAERELIHVPVKHLGRKLFHLVGGLLLLSLYSLVDRSTAFSIYSALVILVLLFEIVRLKLPAGNRFLYQYFGSFFRETEKQTLTGTVPYILGISLALYAYSTAVASAAVCFLAFGDVAATTIGERFGKTKIGNKSLEGTAAFVTAALASGFALHMLGVGVTPWVLVLGAVVAAGVELVPYLLNDNFAIPIVSGAIMELALRWVR